MSCVIMCSVKNKTAYCNTAQKTSAIIIYDKYMCTSKYFFSTQLIFNFYTETLQSEKNCKKGTHVDISGIKYDF